jgi:trk system potassium uptake protein
MAIGAGTFTSMSMMTPRRRATRAVAPRRHPARVVLIAFAFAIGCSTALLMLPVAAESGDGAPFRVALFTATSAVCVTGHIVVDTPSYWSTFGELVILGSIQLGGLGMMTSASLLGLLVFRRLGLRSRLVAQAETKTLALGDMRRVLGGVVITSVVIETGLALVLFGSFWRDAHESAGRAAYLGIFHSISAFNNAGFALWSDNLIRFVTDPWVIVPITIGIILGGLGFPVLFELRRELRTPALWSLHTKVTLLTSGILLAGGWVFITAFEWRNPQTLGPLGVPGKLLAAFFQAVTPRTAGFNSLDYSQMNETTWLTTDTLMFIGGGTASTAGGIKVTTFMILFFAIIAEVRADPDVDAFERRIPGGAIRQALAVALLGVALVVTGTLALLALTDLDLDRVLFEVISAFATVGLSTGITAGLPPAAQYVLIALMYFGRLGPVTVASALALHQGHKLFRYPEERPLVG